MSGLPASVPPFPTEYRASGLLLHVTSLPSQYGIGDLGSSAFSRVDRLHDAGQRWWQALPLGPTGYGNSPYQSMSSFAGNAMVISPASLIMEGLLKATDRKYDFAPDVVDCDSVIPFKNNLLVKLGEASKPVGDWKEGWEAARKRAGVACRFHDLRHTGCTRMLEAGVPFSVVSDVMGWSPSRAVRMARSAMDILDTQQEARPWTSWRVRRFLMQRGIKVGTVADFRDGPCRASA